MRPAAWNASAGALPFVRSAQLVMSVFKLRIGVAIALTALAGWAVTPGSQLTGWQVFTLGIAVLLASASAGAFNQYAEADVDARMARTRRRAFVSGGLRRSAVWPIAIGLLCTLAVGAAWHVLNPLSAMYVFLGAFVYGVVYTVWLKRRTWLNIVVGGLAGSFAVLAGAAAVDPGIGINAWILAVVLFLWTPPHFWSLATAYRQDYEAARIPMLPVVAGDALCARVIFAHTVVLVSLSLLPAFLGLGGIYFSLALTGGALFLYKSWHLMRAPGPKAAMANFHASLLQLTLLLCGALLDRALS
ncbi:MAG: heme o synthase [Burkholderiales bacterium]